MRIANNKKRIQVLWRPAPDAPAVWMVAHAMRVHIVIPSWKHAAIYSYRRGPLVFFVHQPTGLNVSFGATVNRAMERFKKSIEGMTYEYWAEMLGNTYLLGNYPERPTL